MTKVIEKEIDLEKKITPKEKDIRVSLLEQLKSQNRLTSVNIDLVNDYISHWKVKKELIADISTKGVRYRSVNGNGIAVYKANESIAGLQKETAIMLKILGDLSLKDSVIPKDNDSLDDYC